ncbi:hypothetical protein HID58_014396, partial [Brassica napus]
QNPTVGEFDFVTSSTTIKAMNSFNSIMSSMLFISLDSTYINSPESKSHLVASMDEKQSDFQPQSSGNIDHQSEITTKAPTESTTGFMDKKKGLLGSIYSPDPAKNKIFIGLDLLFMAKRYGLIFYVPEFHIFLCITQNRVSRYKHFLKRPIHSSKQSLAIEFDWFWFYSSKEFEAGCVLKGDLYGNVDLQDSAFELC